MKRLLAGILGFSAVFLVSWEMGQTLPRERTQASAPAPAQQAYTLLLGGSTDDAAALQAALDGLASQGTLELRGAFTLADPVSCLGKIVTVQAGGAMLTYTGTDTQPALTFGYAPGDKHTYQEGLTIRGLRLTGPGGTSGAIGLRIQNCYCPVVEDLAIRSFGVGLELVADGVNCTYGRYVLRRFKDNGTQIHAVARNGGAVTENTFAGPGNLSYNTPFAGKSCTHVLTETDGKTGSVVGSLRFEGCSFEAQDDNCTLANIPAGGNFVWVACRFETINHKPMPLKLGKSTYRCAVMGSTSGDVVLQSQAPGNAGHVFLPYWK